MVNNKKLFEKATKKINIKIETKSESIFSFKSFKLKVKVYLYKLFYNFLHAFSDKNFYDSFILSFSIHFTFILITIIYTVFFNTFFRKSDLTVKQDNVVVFDLSNLKVGKDDNLSKVKFEQKQTKLSKKHNRHKTIKQKNPKDQKVSKIDNAYNIKDTKVSIKNDKQKNLKQTKKNLENEKILSVDKSKDLLINVKKGIEAESINNIDVPAGIDSRRSESEQKELQISYVNAVKFRVQNCWNIDAGIKDIRNIVVKITINLFKTGYVQSIDVTNTADYNNLQSFNVVADSAKRAIISCAPYEFSIDRYDYWKTINFNFYPDKQKVE